MLLSDLDMWVCRYSSFSTKYPTVGFDMNQHRVDELMQGHDSTLEVSDELHSYSEVAYIKIMAFK